MRLYIKNMVCNRCIMVVEQQLKVLGLHPANIRLGEAEITEDSISLLQYHQLSKSLSEIGFELLDDKKGKLVEEIKNLIIEHIHYKKEAIHVNFSDFLASRLNREYSSLSRLFSEMEGITIEKYVILQKTEKVKELLVYNELTLSEIAFELGYSSVAHLSGQFKKITGLTPGHFKQLKGSKRISLDRIS